MQERSTLSSAVTRRLVDHARCLGFDLVAVTNAMRPLTSGAYLDWVARGYHGDMDYLTRADAVARRLEPGLILPGLGSALVVGQGYFVSSLPARLREDASRGIITAYAWGADYHLSMVSRLKELADLISDEAGYPIVSHAYVDTGPVLERDLARRAGLGFIGKNTNLIHPVLGSWLFLGEVLVGAELSVGSPEKPSLENEGRLGGPWLRSRAGRLAARAQWRQTGRATATGTCGGCTRCLEACPTGALAAPYVLDARRCISYLTIENKGLIPRELRASLRNRIFGCDICQEVCPWNRHLVRAPGMPGSLPSDDTMAPSLLDLVGLDEAGFRERFRDSPLLRAKRRGLLRNVAVALGNWGDPAAVAALLRVLGDSEPLIRAHAAWALGRIATPGAHDALERALAAETDASVEAEIRTALS